MSKITHPYHLVDPSPLPIFTSFAALVAACGAIMYMHDVAYGGWIMSGGLLAIVYCLFCWWKAVVGEAKNDKAHTSAVQHGLRLGMALFILSEVMFFFAFFFAFFSVSLFPVDILDGVWGAAAGVWPPEGIKTFDPWDLPFLNTLVLLLSGTTVTWAHHALLHGDQKGLVQGLTYTVGLGVLFTILQAYEYSHAAFGFTDGVYASVFYMATGFHGFHVIVGTIFLAVCLQRAKKGQLSEKHHLGFEFAAWYWHFVDVVWLFLFVCIYWWGA